MPDITTETPRDTFTIGGHEFQVYEPYAEGHTLNANEAASLNQTFAENVRNNFAKKVAEAKEKGDDPADLQSDLDAYMSSYEFGVRTGGGGRITDPVQAKAMDLARDKVREALKASKQTASAADITKLARQVLDKYPQITEVARAQVEAAKQIASVQLDSLGEGAAEAPEAEVAPATRRSRA